MGDSTHVVTSLFTSLKTGQTLAVCDDDMPIALIGQLSALLGVDMDALYASIERFVDREVKKAAKAVEAAALADAQAAEAAEAAEPMEDEDPTTGDMITLPDQASENTGQEVTQ